ncbi:MAG: competence protein ComK [Bacilli bacterium]|nr:competence protein ComK [Bacilli bacterium]
MLNEYEINSATQAIIPLDEDKAMVYEEEGEYIVDKPANQIINYNCNFYGSSYDGRCEGTRSLIGIKSKLPIIIEESRDIIFFPTNSIRRKQSTWIALNKISSLHKNEKNSFIIFTDGRKIDFDISMFSLENQYCRAIMLKSKLNDRKMLKKNI